MTNKKIILPDGLTHKGLEVGIPTGKPIDLDKLEYLIEFIETYFKPRLSICYNHSSPGLKHLVERCFNYDIYVSNGEIIAAMLLCGYQYVKISANSTNCRFNVCRISKKKEKIIMSEILHSKKKKKKHGKQLFN